MNQPVETHLSEPRTLQAEDMIEWCYQQGYSDGFPLVPPTPVS